MAIRCMSRISYIGPIVRNFSTSSLLLLDAYRPVSNHTLGDPTSSEKGRFPLAATLVAFDIVVRVQSRRQTGEARQDSPARL